MSLPAVTEQIIRSVISGFQSWSCWNQNHGRWAVLPNASTGGKGSLIYSKEKGAYVEISETFETMYAWYSCTGSVEG